MKKNSLLAFALFVFGIAFSYSQVRIKPIDRSSNLTQLSKIGTVESECRTDLYVGNNHLDGLYRIIFDVYDTTASYVLMPQSYQAYDTCKILYGSPKDVKKMFSTDDPIWNIDGSYDAKKPIIMFIEGEAVKSPIASSKSNVSYNSSNIYKDAWSDVSGRVDYWEDMMDSNYGYWEK